MLNYLNGVDEIGAFKKIKAKIKAKNIQKQAIKKQAIQKQAIKKQEIKRKAIQQKAINKIVKKQVSQEEMNYFLNNGMWPWSEEVIELYREAVERNKLIRK